MDSLQDWVERSRIKRGLTQDQLAERANLSRAMINRIETGRVTTVSSLTLTRLIAALRLQPPREILDAAIADRRRKRASKGKRQDDGLDFDITEIFADQVPLPPWREPMRVPVNEIGNETNSAIGEAQPPGELPDDIPLLADVRGGLPDGGVYDGTIEAQLPVRRLYGIRDPQAFALRVVGDSMAPRMPEETVVYVSPNEDRVDGEACFVQFGGERDYMATIKNVFDAGEDWLLVASNQNFEPQTERIPKSHVLRVLPIVRYSVPTR